MNWLENKKYGEIIIKTPLKELKKWIKLIEKSKLKRYEIKLYKTHFVKYLERSDIYNDKTI